MKKMMVLLALALVMFSGSAFAATSATMTVSAQVVESCSITSANMNFGTIDPFSIVADATATADLTVTCSGAIPFNVSDDKGGASSLVDGALNLPYTLAYANAGVGTSTITVTGTVALADAQNATPSVGYTDSVVFTITP